MIAGDESAFEKFSDEYIPALYRFAIRRLQGDRELAPDIVQSTVCRALEKLTSFRGEAALMTWLCAVCSNEIAGHFRRGAWRSKEVDFQQHEDLLGASLAESSGSRLDGPERATLCREVAECVHDVLDALPPHYGKVLEWKYLEDLSVKEIARRLDLTPKAAESLLTRARQAFRDGYNHMVDNRDSALDEAQALSRRMAAAS
jgi:RNA polymerase sigma-70 factor (ECF subfamily)